MEQKKIEEKYSLKKKIMLAFHVVFAIVYWIVSPMNTSVQAPAVSLWTFNPILSIIIPAIILWVTCPRNEKGYKITPIIMGGYIDFYYIRGYINLILLKDDISTVYDINMQQIIDNFGVLVIIAIILSVFIILSGCGFFWRLNKKKKERKDDLIIQNIADDTYDFDGNHDQLDLVNDNKNEKRTENKLIKRDIFKRNKINFFSNLKIIFSVIVMFLIISVVYFLGYNHGSEKKEVSASKIKVTLLDENKKRDDNINDSDSYDWRESARNILRSLEEKSEEEPTEEEIIEEEIIEEEPINNDICIINGCNRIASYHSVYCLNHTCSEIDCFNKIEGNSGYCLTHKCFYPDCNNKSAYRSYYCYFHKCSNASCSNKIKDSDSSYCVEHACIYPGCNFEASINSFYCIIHD